MIQSQNKSEKGGKNIARTAAKKISKESAERKFVEFKNINKALETAVYYGFTPVPKLVVEEIDADRARKLIEEESVNKDDIVSRPLAITLEEKNSLLRYYNENNLIAETQPVMISLKNGSRATGGKKTSTKEIPVSLQALGSTKSITEAILIKTAFSIFSDNGIRDIYVEINSIGDRESTNKFTRELANYYRKNINKMPPHCRQLFKKDPFSLLECEEKKYCSSLNEEAPQSISFLSEASRQHFKEVLEDLEILDIPYRINNSLVPDRRHCSQTVFEIIRGGENKKEVLASGERYDGLAKKIGLKKDIPAIGLKISSEALGDNSTISSRIKMPVFFFIQLGFESKLKGLNIIEMLRKVKIMLYQSLSRDMLGGQIALAEKMKVPYAIIMGKKESMENTVMVRNMSTRSQDTVPVSGLAAYLKKLV